MALDFAGTATVNERNTRCARRIDTYWDACVFQGINASKENNMISGSPSREEEIVTGCNFTTLSRHRKVGRMPSERANLPTQSLRVADISKPVGPRYRKIPIRQVPTTNGSEEKCSQAVLSSIVQVMLTVLYPRICRTPYISHRPYNEIDSQCVPCSYEAIRNASKDANRT